MQFKVIHHGRRWRRVDNHMDCRHCPQCGATVNGNRGQHAHLQWHIDLDEVLQRIIDRAAVEPEQPVPWTAVVDNSIDPEAVNG